MEKTQYFLRLAEETFGLSVPVMVLVTIVVGFFAWEGVSRGRLKLWDVPRALSLLSLPLGILVWGTWREHTTSVWDRSVQNAAPWEFHILNLLAVGALAVLAIVVWRSPGRRAFMSAWSCVILLWVLMAWFISAMSIGGDWI